MDQEPANEIQGLRLPPSRFASPLSRRSTIANQALARGLRRAGLCLLALAALPLPHCVAQTVQPRSPQFTNVSASIPTAATASFAAHRARVQRFVVERAIGQVQPSTTTPALALQHARGQHLALLQQRSSLQAPQSLPRAQAAPSAPRAAAANLTAAWQPLGPSSIVSPTFGNLTGRITTIAPDPNDPTGNTVYLGTTGGGVWKSSNAAGPLGAASFAPLTDTLSVFSANAGSGVIPSLSIGAVAVQPAVDPVVLAGTGDPNDATDSLYGEGLLRSADGGLTWTLIQGTLRGTNATYSFSGLATAGLAFSTASPTLVVAAFSVSPQSAIDNAANFTSIPGLYYSADAGQTWQMATLYDGASIVQEPQPIGTAQTGNAATSVVWDAQRGQFFAAVRGHGYYYSSDGQNWYRLTAQPGTNLTTAKCPVGANGGGTGTCPIFRGTLAVQPATGDLYALTVDANDVDQGLWQDLCHVTTGTCATPEPVFTTRLDQGALEVGSAGGAVGNGSTAITQGSYNLTLAAAPAAGNGTLLFAGTVDLYRCSMAFGATSCALRNTTNALDGCNAPAAVAPAQHALAAVAQSSGTPILYLGNDGGLWRSLDGVAETGSVCSASDKTHFDNLNSAIGAGGSLAEIVGLAQDPNSPDTLLAGLGANGSVATTSAAQLSAWPQLSAGEGGYPQLDPNTSTNWYISTGAGVNLAQCTLGSACTAANFVPPATIGEPQVSYDFSLLDAPTLLDPTLTTNLLTATCRVWRGPAASGATWSSSNALSPAFDGSATPCTAASPLIRAMAAGGPSISSGSPQFAGSQVLYAGIAGSLDGGGSVPGHLFVTTTADTAPIWTDAALSPVTNDISHAHAFNPDAFDVSSVVADPHDATGATVYATVMGFGAPHLYRSVDFGQHWLNLSANLPDAPANAVLVDPNDAKTVYIAMDTGIYATQQIATCSNPAINCWSVLGTALPNSPAVALAAAASLPTGDGRLGMLRVATYGRGIWEQPLLTAHFPAQPAITLSATSFTFASQQVATQSAAQIITVTSTGNAPVIFGSSAIVLNSGDFTETDTCAGQTLTVSATCTVQIVFAPTATGARSGLLTLYANIAGGQATATLSGNGTTPAAVVLTPLTLTFLPTLVNQTSAQQIVTIANTGGNPATLQTPVLAGNSTDFTLVADTCGATLAASTACSISIAFHPTASGTRAATLSITDSAGTQTAQLTGTGQSPATDTLSPLALAFAQQQVGTTSPAQGVTLTNSGDVALTLIAASLSPGDFTVANACGNSLAAHSTCALEVSFVPSATGARTATLTVTDQFHFQTVSLSGTGVAPPGVSLSPLTLSFPATGTGLTSTPQTLTLTNNGGLPLTISSISPSAGFVIAAATCPATLAINTACTLQVVFAPTAAGAVSGALTLTDNAPSGTQTASLTGTGIDFTLAASGPTSATLSGTQSASYPLLLSSLSGLSGNVALTCTGAPAHSTCTVSPATASLGGTVSVVATVETGVALAALSPTGLPSSPFTPRSRDIFFALLLPLALAGKKSRLRCPKLLLTLALMAIPLTTLNGCGAARDIPISTTTTTSTPTGPGTYNLTVSASAAGLTRRVGLTLIVQ